MIFIHSYGVSAVLSKSPFCFGIFVSGYTGYCLLFYYKSRLFRGMGYILLRCFSVTCAVFHQLQVRQTPVNPVKIPFSDRANIQIKTDLL